MDAKHSGTLASESKSRETSKSGTKVETSNADVHKATPSTSATSTLKVDDKQTVKSSISTSISEKKSKVADTVVNAPGTTTNLEKKSGSGEAQQSVKVDSSIPSSEISDRKPNGLPPVSPQSKQGEKPSATQPAKPGTALEENIVLGAALEGSKRTLPIDDDHQAFPQPVEEKEAAANRNSNGNGRGTASYEKDEKDK